MQRRSIAYVLSDLLRALDDRTGFERGFLRPQALVGHGGSADQSTEVGHALPVSMSLVKMELS